MNEAIQAFGNLGLLGMFFLVMLLGCCLRVILLIFSRLYRAVMVICRGWPPEHLDADGDWKPQPAASEDD